MLRKMPWRASMPNVSIASWSRGLESIDTAAIDLYEDLGFPPINKTFSTHDQLEDWLVNRPATIVNAFPEWIHSEGDIGPTFYRHIVGPIFVGFEGPMPFLILRSELGPLGNTNVKETINM